MKKFSKLRYMIALLLVLATVSTVTTPSTKGTVTPFSEPGYNWWLETR